ncbi:Hypothetical predicted protein [Cloeon dipterum]|uniref:Exosome complex component RRP45 n=1 Tax=Cloeon dipterum TaxID=197152 RepID=A0A8S1CVX5_9INSE|nr:Hypothetical predicted protein [Cloeon dipterum]
MKEPIISNCEKAFLLEAISESRRLDGRGMFDYRDLSIRFGKDYGCCEVSMGQTRVLGQVSCEIQQPKATRPNEGLLHINVGLSPMGAPHFETGRQSISSIQLNRLLEKCIKDSKCIDLESLCIVAEEKVWCIRLDLNILNHEGNLIDCASVAALAALSHFRRPDVELTSEGLIIYEAAVKEPIPLGIKHTPICVSFAIFNKGKNIVVDPSELEERVAEAEFTLGVNGYKELCGVHLSGSTQSGPTIVRQCANKALKRAVSVVALIKETLAKDSELRGSNTERGFVECVRQGTITSHGTPKICLPIKHKLPVETMETNHEDESSCDEVEVIGSGTVELKNSSVLATDTAEQVMEVEEKPKVEEIALSDDEDEVQIL